MYLVVTRWFNGVNDSICVVTETEEKANEWTCKEMDGKVYSGLGVHKIIPIKLYS